MSQYLIDTNVFFKIFGNNASVKSYVESLDASIDSTVYIECIQGIKSNKEKSIIKTYLDNFPLILTNANISRKTIELIDSYSNSHGLLLPDALIAACAIENDLTLVTYNIGDFKFIKGLKYIEPSI